MQAEISKSMEPSAKKYNKPDGHNIKGEISRQKFILSDKNASARYREVILKIWLPIYY